MCWNGIWQPPNMGQKAKSVESCFICEQFGWYHEPADKIKKQQNKSLKKPSKTFGIIVNEFAATAWWPRTLITCNTKTPLTLKTASICIEYHACIAPSDNTKKKKPNNCDIYHKQCTKEGSFAVVSRSSVYIDFWAPCTHFYFYR